MFSPHHRRSRVLRGRALAPALVALALALPAGAQEGAEDPPAPAPPPADSGADPAPVALDRLLRLPDSVEYDMEERGGATADEWRARFERARSAVVAAREQVEDAQRRLEEEATSESAWKVAPPGLGGVPGGGGSEAPANYKLSMELRRAKDDHAAARRALRDLTIEANLAGVPESWRE